MNNTEKMKTDIANEFGQRFGQLGVDDATRMMSIVARDFNKFGISWNGSLVNELKAEGFLPSSSSSEQTSDDVELLVKDYCWFMIDWNSIIYQTSLEKRNGR